MKKKLHCFCMWSCVCAGRMMWICLTKHDKRCLLTYMNWDCFEVQMKFKLLLLIELKNSIFFAANTGMKLLRSLCGERDDTKLTVWSLKLHVVSWVDYGQHYRVHVSFYSKWVWITQQKIDVHVDFNVHRIQHDLR